MWNKREDEVSCRSHQAEMNSTFQSGNIRPKLSKGETDEVERGGECRNGITSTNETLKMMWHGGPYLLITELQSNVLILSL